MFGALIEESEILPFSELPCANFLCRGSIVYKKVIWEKKKKRKNWRFLDGLSFSSVIWSYQHQQWDLLPPKLLTAPLIFMHTSVLESVYWNGIDPVQNSSALPDSTFCFFFFFVLDQFLDLIHHVDPQVVESAQLRLACCSVMAEMNTKRKWEQREEDRPEHDS